MSKDNTVKTDELDKVSATELQLIDYVRSLDKDEAEVFNIILRALVEMTEEQANIFRARSSNKVDILRNVEIAWQIYDEAQGNKEDYHKIFIERIMSEAPAEQAD